MTVIYSNIGYSPNFTWLVTSRLDTFDVSSPCILAVSSLSNSTARLARHDEIDWLNTLVSTRSTKSNVSSRVETSQVEFWPILATRVYFWFWLQLQCRTHTLVSIVFRAWLEICVHREMMFLCIWNRTNSCVTAWSSANNRAVFVKFQQGGWLFRGSQRPAADDKILNASTRWGHPHMQSGTW